MEPEAITQSRVARFLAFRDEYGHAPSGAVRAAPARPEVSHFEITPDGDEEEPADYDPLERYRELATDDDDGDDGSLPTLEFDQRDRRGLERKTRQLGEAEEQHGRWIRRLGDDPRDREVLRNCRPRGVRPQVGGFRVSERLPAVPPPDGWGKGGSAPESRRTEVAMRYMDRIA
ncbi:hypothetical protein DL765_011150 [Monosporascus sp. GIB2]|nr:hypothetical protein DL765_011150 [Monosporascus sp. GIB2]